MDLMLKRLAILWLVVMLALLIAQPRFSRENRSWVAQHQFEVDTGYPHAIYLELLEGHHGKNLTQTTKNC